MTYPLHSVVGVSCLEDLSVAGTGRPYDVQLLASRNKHVALRLASCGEKRIHRPKSREFVGPFVGRAVDKGGKS